MDAIQGETVHTTTRMDADSVLDTSESPVTTSAIEERLIGTYIPPLPLPTAGNGQDATPPDGELASDLGIAAFGLGFYPKFTPDDIYYTVHVEHLKYQDISGLGHTTSRYTTVVSEGETNVPSKYERLSTGNRTPWIFLSLSDIHANGRRMF